MSRAGWVGWWNGPVNMAVTDSAESRGCCGGKDGEHKRVERLRKQEGLKVPSKQPQRRRLGLHDGSCIRLRASDQDQVWSYDFVHERTHDGRAFRLLTVVDEYTRECLAIDVN